jgi:NAD(P)-dependent dehydrogenase (short-subunit alcohol dehydrogenase family)
MVSSRTALVTGSARGLGLAIGARLARDGFHVVLGDVDAGLLGEAAATLVDEGLDVVPVAMDVTDDASVRAAFEALDGSALDVLVNNAGIISRRPAEDFDSAAWEREMSVNLGGTMRCSREAFPHLVRSASPSIVNLASVGSTFGLPHRLGYATTKTGIVGLTRTLAVEWGPRGIRVNAVAPGYIETPMMLSGFDSGALDRDRLIGRTPMRRFGSAEEIAAAVSFLVSPDASFVTGTVLKVDGGITVDGTFHVDPTPVPN